MADARHISQAVGTLTDVSLYQLGICATVYWEACATLKGLGMDIGHRRGQVYLMPIAFQLFL